VGTLSKRRIDETQDKAFSKPRNIGLSLSSCRLKKRRLIKSLGVQLNERMGIAHIAHILWRTKFLHFSWEADTPWKSPVFSFPPKKEKDLFVIEACGYVGKSKTCPRPVCQREALSIRAAYPQPESFLLLKGSVKDKRIEQAILSLKALILSVFRDFSCIQCLHIYRLAALCCIQCLHILGRVASSTSIFSCHNF
jgi:hypothetical protein